MNEEEEELQIITTIDEFGKETNLKLCDVVIVDDQQYALLLPEEADLDAMDEEMVLMRLTHVNDEYIFEAIEDDDEFDLVAQAIIDDSAANADRDDD